MEQASGGKYRKNWDPSEHYKDIAVAEAYDKARFSSVAGRVFDRLEKNALGKALSALPNDSLILDAPTGTGRLAEKMLQMGHRVVGADISPQMLHVAERKLAPFGDRYTTIHSDVHDLHGDALHVDAVVCARVLMHFPLSEQIDFLSAVAKLTDGPVIFNQSVVTGYHRARRALKKMLRNQAPAAFPLSSDEVNQLIDGAGLVEEQRYSVMPAVSEAVFFVCRKRHQA
ncbi:methyltransferase domain-containing protein [Thiosocius teredinicola]|uniref:methyltransferase domain-containing protein n=1 Tax=Thiosocius teredinicola TaxID=1973002 RepID=UPI0009910364